MVNAIVHADIKTALIHERVEPGPARDLLLANLDRLQLCGWLVMVADPADPPPPQVFGEGYVVAKPDGRGLAGWVGGLPCLPVDMAWPLAGAALLPYVFGVDLAALPPWLGLPSAGTLHLFAAHDAVQVVVVPPGVAVVQRPAPIVPYLNHFPGFGLTHGRWLLDLEPGLCLAEEDRGAADKELRTVLRKALGSPSATPLARIGGGIVGGPAEAGRVCRKAYCAAHGRPSIDADDPDLAEVDRLIAEAERSPSGGPAPVQVPAAVTARLEREARDGLTAAAAILDGLGDEPAEHTAVLAQAATDLRAAAGRLDDGGLDDHIDLLHAIVAWHAAVTFAPPRQREVIARHYSLAVLTARLLANEASRLASYAAWRAESSDDPPDRDEPLPVDPNVATHILLRRLGADDRRATDDPAAMRTALLALENHLETHADALSTATLIQALERRLRGWYAIAPLEALRAFRSTVAWWDADPVGHRADIARWRLLLAVHSVADFTWSYKGRLLVLIDGDDLARGDFSQVQGSITA